MIDVKSFRPAICVCVRGRLEGNKEEEEEHNLSAQNVDTATTPDGTR